VATISSCHRGMDPHYIFGGHTLSQYHHGSVVYLLVAMLWVTYSLSISMTTLGMEHILTLFDGFLKLLPGSLTPYPCFEESTKHFGHQISYFDFTLWGSTCYTSKFITSIMSHSHCCKCWKCLTFVASVLSITFSLFKCHITNDTMKTLDTTPKTC